VKFNRSDAVLSLLAAGALVLSACGSNNNASSSGAGATSGSSGMKVECGGKKALQASGSTAQANAMTRFIKAHEQACPGYIVDYTANGSAVGVSEFVRNLTDFGGSESPLNKDQGEYDAAAKRCGSDAWNLPVVFGPIAVTYNVNGVDSLVLDGPTAAKIFNGTINRWDDPALKALNGKATLPSEPIQVVFRSGDSGTTDSFQKYLDVASNGAWGKGVGKSFNGGVGEGAIGSDGAAATIANTHGSIGYNEWSFAQAQKLSMAKIVTSAGPDPVAISTDSVAKTIAGATLTGQGNGNDLVLDTASFYKPTQPRAYPVVSPTYEIVCSKYPDSQVGMAVKAFLQSTIGPGQNGLADNGYIPLPASLQSKLSMAVDAIA
jgi:phosphate transport system substrate-binding protein